MSRRLAVHFGAIVAIVVCLLLSNWQWQRAHVYTQAPSASGDYTQLSPTRDYLPVSSIGVQTTIAGTWVAGSGRLYCERAANLTQPGTGCLATALLQLADETSAIVLLGHTEDATWNAFPNGPGEVSGVLQPSEDSVYLESKLPNAITTTSYLDISPGILHDGFLIHSTLSHGLRPVTDVLDQAPVASLHWRNVVYTFNWLAFAIIVAAMWRRVILDMRQDEAN